MNFQIFFFYNKSLSSSNILSLPESKGKNTFSYKNMESSESVKQT